MLTQEEYKMSQENAITVDTEHKKKMEQEQKIEQNRETELVNKKPELTIPLRSPNSKNKSQAYSLSGDGNMDDSIGDTLHIEGQLNRADIVYLRTVSKEMRELDVEIQRAQENGWPEKAEAMANLWEQKRTSLIIYLKKNKIRICPMKQKDKEKIWDKAEEKEAQIKKHKTNVYLKNRDHGYGRERMKNWE